MINKNAMTLQRIIYTWYKRINKVWIFCQNAKNMFLCSVFNFYDFYDDCETWLFCESTRDQSNPTRNQSESRIPAGFLVSSSRFTFYKTRWVK